MRVAVGAALCRTGADMDAETVATAILSLARLEVCWARHLSDDVSAALRGAVTRQVTPAPLPLLSRPFGAYLQCIHYP